MPGNDVDHDVYFARESLQDGLRQGHVAGSNGKIVVESTMCRTANIAGTVVQFVLQRGLHGKPQVAGQTYGTIYSGSGSHEGCTTARQRVCDRLMGRLRQWPTTEAGAKGIPELNR